MLQTDPMQWVNQDSQADQGPPHDRGRGRLVDRARRVRAGRPTCSPTRPCGSCTTSATQQLEQFGPESDAPRQLLTASSIEEILVRRHLRSPGADRLRADRRRGQAGLRGGPARPAASARQRRRHGVEHRVPRRPGLARRPGAGRRRRPRRTSQAAPEGTTATPSGLAVVGVGLLENLEANRVLLTYLAILFVFLFLAVRLRSIVRALLSLVPVLIAVGAASLVAYASASSSAR